MNYFHDNTVTDLYTACQEGDYQLALALLETLEFNAINRLESNGSTALHIAAALGHADIVSLLLHVYSVMRDQKDHYDRTAYEVACNDEIRRLFHRPKTNNRFCSNDNNISANFFRIRQDTSPSDRVQQYENVSEVRRKQLQEVEKQVKSLGELFFDTFKKFFQSKEAPREMLWASNLLSIIEEQLGKSHNQYSQACELIHRYKETFNIEPLLCLYTLDTRFYQYLTKSKDSSNCLAQPLLDKLHTLRCRAFQGNSFRGLSMTHEDLQVYYWAHQEKDRHLETNIFSSTSIDENVANFFIEAHKNEGKVNVLVEFVFPKTCSTAIRLYTISPELTCISNFEDEREVLILPGTVFRVENIIRNGNNVRIMFNHYRMEDDIDEYRSVLYDHNLPDW
jgi:hypothetical protein